MIRLVVGLDDLATVTVSRAYHTPRAIVPERGRTEPSAKRKWGASWNEPV